VERKLKGLIDAIAEDFRARGLQSQLDELKARQAALTARPNTLAPRQPRLRPNLAEVYRDKVARLREALQRALIWRRPIVWRPATDVIMRSLIAPIE
jgi:site-specific DNA recombinase